MNLDRLRSANLSILLMSFCLALALWGVVFTQESTTTTQTLLISLSYPNTLDPNLVLVNQPTSIFVEVTTSAEHMKEIANRQWIGDVLLTGAKPGHQTYQVGLPPGIRDIAKESKGKVDLVIEKVMKRSIPLQAVTKGKLNDTSTVLSDRTVSPSSVVISGPGTAVANVGEARVVLDLDQESPQNPTTQQNYVYLYDSNGVQLDTEKLGIRTDPPIGEVTPVFMSAPQQRIVSVLPQFANQPSAGFRTGSFVVQPPTVTVTGSSSALAQISQILTEPVNLEGLSQSNQFKVKVILPKGVSQSRPVSVKVRVEILPASIAKKP
jgi:YbbR domain-containing protein